MNITAPKKAMLRLLPRCNGVIDKKSPIPILANVLLSADVGVLSIAATDMYLSVSGSLKVEVKQPGSVAAPALNMYDRIKAMPDGPVRISTNDKDAIVIKSVGAARRYTLHGLPGVDFPELPKPGDDAASFTMTSEDLGQLIGKTHFSVSEDRTRPHLNSALFEVAGDVARMVSTDGHRLSKAEVPLLNTKPLSMLVPLKAINELRKMTDATKGDDTIGIKQWGDSVFFSVGDIVLSAKLIDAEFPPYEAVIPQSNGKQILAPRLQLNDALRAVSLSASERTGGVKLDVVDGFMRLTSESPDGGGSGFDELPVNYVGDAISVGVNARYMLDVLCAMSDEEVSLSISGELDPVAIRPANGDDYVAVVMPMRI